MDASIYAQDTNRSRERREAVARLLANLKGFLNVVSAKFFFIGGREMFDADLADIADRESFYSSIFNDVIYVDSFFKDSAKDAGNRSGGITEMTETYLVNMISNGHPSILGLKGLFESLRIDNEGVVVVGSIQNGKESEEERRKKYKVIFTLQNYVIYLTYRSNGTPKKLTGLTEQLIVRGPTKKEDESQRDCNEAFFRTNLVVLHESADKSLDADLSKRLFLKFGYNTQYEIGMTSNLYRPFLIANSRELKSLGDKLLFSSSFIIDHILKFHPFGFSWRNLELIPEVVLVNREPNLREFIEELMRFYSMTYIRDTVSGIFDYRFRSIIRRELIHLSKTSDLSSAAFNFTLDESLATKRHYKRKLIELRDKYANYTPVDGDNHFVHSLCFVQTILGDLHYYDKEYDEAILSIPSRFRRFRDAVANRKMTRHQFLLWLRNKLKLGLTLEKIRAFDSAFSIYKTLVLDTNRYFQHLGGISKLDSNERRAWRRISKTSYIDALSEAEDHRTIQFVSMPFVALIAVTEKAR
ncbi:MAG: hypothetical protein IPN69_17510, partial [Acidobacteria bacterium]|nr:hypothetical protein [Acidobacteriota bacterium]